ncbi:DUF1254 domain-containing protein [Umezawaea tangerina]|uniref:DUF1254 domain-containing protein n=1 Tax=Umezawaea tangerina TaxID=84725 RepID=A0A2T0SWT0_9PSEU|nr:DUF1254 domain-containing protein [Umezawaea tangerina]PRY37849.1 hypothetical protein CLV43_10969 [Umezawaea tangerina]
MTSRQPTRRTVLRSAAVLGLAGLGGTGRALAADSPPTSAAADGYVYGYAPVTLARTRAAGLAATGVNELARQVALATPRSTRVVAPNVDTLYCSAWLDLRDGPVVLSIPDGGDRFRVFQFLDVWTNTIANVGTRTTGQGAGRFAVVPPGWTGASPSDVTAIPVPCWDVWLIGRTLVRGPDDVAAARAVQRTYGLAALPGTTPPVGAPPRLPAPRPGNPPNPQDPADGGVTFFDELAAILAADPPPSADAPLLDRLAALGVVAGATPSTGTPANVAALTAGVAEGDALVTEAARTPLSPAGTWGTSLDLGTYGTDYLLRAATAKRALAANLPAESLYYTSRGDVNGEALTGTTTYRLTFPTPADLPPTAAGGFWSFTVYGEDMFLVDNPIDRYAIGDRTPDLTHNPDGSLDLYISATPPPTHEPNWLPAPPGPFTVMARLYSPTTPWTPPPFHPV